MAVNQLTDTNDITRSYLDSILLTQNLVDSTLPSIETTIFGTTFASPIMTPAFSHLKAVTPERESAMVEYARAAKNVNVLNWVGMEPDEEILPILSTGAKTVRIIKPFKDHDTILSQMKVAEENGAFAVGIDIDHVYGDDGKYDIVDGQEMGPVTAEDLETYVKATKLPFVIKGVLGITDAEKCAKAGVSGIVVSHHHGRLSYAVPPLMILPEIKAALAGTKVTIFADCHIDTGVDAFKALALGADAVSVGRAMLEPLTKEGTAGVEAKLRKMNEELITVMGYTGFPRVADIDDSVIVLS